MDKLKVKCTKEWPGHFTVGRTYYIDLKESDKAIVVTEQFVTIDLTICYDHFDILIGDMWLLSNIANGTCKEEDEAYLKLKYYC